MLVDPSVLADVISVTPAMRPNWRSSGAATDVAMVSGLAPGKFAETEIVGYSTWGNAATGSIRKAMIPTSASAIVNNVVAIGRVIKGAERFMWLAGMRIEGCLCGQRYGPTLTDTFGDAVEREIDDRCGV